MYLRWLIPYLSVNGGVVAIAWLVCVCERCVRRSMPPPCRELCCLIASSLASTALLYTLVFYACWMNLRGRPRVIASGAAAAASSVAWTSIIWHPIGSAFERGMERIWGIPSVRASFSATMLAGLGAHLFVFELIFDLAFYLAHRGVHASPLIYRVVHKLHHSHTHDVSLISGLQMGPLDVVLTHTVPVLFALWAMKQLDMPIHAGIEFSIAKTYLLFQELYGHAGVAHRGKNFGPAPWLPALLGFELRAEDHQRHHIQATCNFAKRFSIFDKLFGTWQSSKTPTY
jgi:sterol desaturase/sphingolipid hydroxylase (fatty acid hydroxylase superfamily)